MAERKDNVGATSCAYDEMAKRWSLLIDLLGGTLAMRAAGNRWLPKEDGESPGKYKSRLNRSILFEAFKDTVEAIVCKPFSRDMAVSELPELLEPVRDDVDRTATSLKQLASDMLRDLATFGKTHALIDFTKVDANAAAARGERGPANMAEEAGARPLIVHVSPQNLIGWDIGDEYDEAGEPVLERVRIREFRTVPVGRYLDRQQEYVRVLTPTQWELWRRRSKEEMNELGVLAAEADEYQLEASGPWTLGRIPLVTIYAQRTGFLTAEPPLEGLAWLNLAHWQSSSDQRNILKVARFAILFLKGCSEDEKDNGLGDLGPQQGFITTEPDADLSYVEHKGHAIEAGRKDLEALEAQMEVMGKAPMIERSARSTATGKAIDHDKNLTQVQKWIRALELGLEECFEWAARWLGIELPDTFKIDIFSDFKVSISGPGDIELLVKLRKAGGLSKETLLSELKRRGFLSEGVDIEAELERLEDEAPPALALDLEDDDGAGPGGDGGGAGDGE